MPSPKQLELLKKLKLSDPQTAVEADLVEEDIRRLEETMSPDEVDSKTLRQAKEKVKRARDKSLVLDAPDVLNQGAGRPAPAAEVEVPSEPVEAKLSRFVHSLAAPRREYERPADPAPKPENKEPKAQTWTKGPALESFAVEKPTPTPAKPIVIDAPKSWQTRLENWLMSPDVPEVTEADPWKSEYDKTYTAKFLAAKKAEAETAAAVEDVPADAPAEVPPTAVTPETPLAPPTEPAAPPGLITDTGEVDKKALDAYRTMGFESALTPPSYDSISAFTEKPPEHLQQKVQYQNPETGETEELTAAELVTEAQTQLAETLVELQKEYRTERDAERSRELWYAIAVGVGQMALGWYGAKRGVDTTGLKFPAIDWAARQRLLLDGYTEDRTTAKDRHAATMQLAQEARYRTEESRKQAWDEYQAKYTKWKTVQDAVVQRNANKQREFQDQVELVKLADAREANKARTDAAKAKASGKLNTDDLKHARLLEKRFDEHLAKAADKKASEEEKQTHIALAGKDNLRFSELVGKPLVPHELFETIPGYVWDTKPDLEKIREAYRKGLATGRPGYTVDANGMVTVEHEETGETQVVHQSRIEDFLATYKDWSAK